MDFKIATECPVCMETYDDPRMLSCGHSFCLKCVKQSAGESSLICPLCREPHQNYTNAFSVPQNVDMRNLIERVKGFVLAGENFGSAGPSGNEIACDECNNRYSAYDMKHCNAHSKYLCARCVTASHNACKCIDGSAHQKTQLAANLKEMEGIKASIDSLKTAAAQFQTEAVNITCVEQNAKRQIDAFGQRLRQVSPLHQAGINELKLELDKAKMDCFNAANSTSKALHQLLPMLNPTKAKSVDIQHVFKMDQHLTEPARELLLSMANAIVDVDILRNALVGAFDTLWRKNNKIMRWYCISYSVDKGGHNYEYDVLLRIVLDSPSVAINLLGVNLEKPMKKQVTTEQLNTFLGKQAQKNHTMARKGQAIKEATETAFGGRWACAYGRTCTVLLNSSIPLTLVSFATVKDSTYVLVKV